MHALRLKTLRRNIWVYLYGLEFCNGFLDMIVKTKATKEKINEFDFFKIKNFCASKDTIRKMKRQLMKWEKIFEKSYI